MELLTIFWRTAFSYFMVFLMMRIMGKREIGKLSIFDLVISIMIAEIAVFVIEDVDKPLLEGIVPMVTLVAIQIAIAYVTLKNQTIRLWFDGKPSVLVENGKLNREEMRKQRYSLDDLLLQLRENNVTDLADVESAVLETTGKLTVVKKENADKKNDRAKSESDGGLEETGSSARIRYEGLPLPLIMDGKVQDQNLQKIGKTRFWLKNQIRERGVSDFKDVFFCSIDHRGRLFLDRK